MTITLMPSRKKRYKHITIHPSQGGALVGSASDDVPIGEESNYLSSSANYTEKLNFRREVDGELRREGWDLFDITGSDDALDAVYPIRALHQFPGTDGTPVLIAIAGHTVYRLMTGDQTYAKDYQSPGNFYSVAPGLDGVVGTSDDIQEEYWKDVGEDFWWKPIYSFSFNSDGSRSTGGGSEQHFMDALEEDGTTKNPFEGGAYRWEIVDVQNHVVINNGVDLPIIFKSEYDVAVPLYSLRENGVISVGTIASHQDRLFCADLTVIQDGYDTWFGSEDPYGNLYTSSLYGQVKSQRYQSQIIHSAEGEPKLFNTGTTASGSFIAESGGIEGSLVVDSSGGYKFDPDYNFSVGGEGSMYRFWMGGNWSGEDAITLNLTTPVAAVKAQDENASNTSTSGLYFKISGQGSNQDLYAVDDPLNPSPTPLYSTGIHGQDYWFSGDTWAIVNSDQNNPVLLDPATGVGLAQGTYSAVLRPYAEQVHAPAQFREFAQDGSRILKMVELADNLVVYRDSGFFFLSKSNSSLSFVVDPRYKGGRTADFRHTIINIDGDRHLFMGNSGIYSINRSSTEPRPIANFELGPPFWQNVPPEFAEYVYTVDNPVTREIFINCPIGYLADGSLEWGVIAYDYVNETLSTIDASFTACASIRKPRHNRIGPEQSWFVMGAHQADIGGKEFVGTQFREDPKYGGVIVRYGYGPPEVGSSEPRRIYNRIGEGYISRIKSGLIDFGDSFSDKEVRSYVLELSSKYGVAPIRVKLSTTTAPQGTEQVETMDKDSDGAPRDFVTLNEIRDENMIPVYIRAPYVRDEITVHPQYVANNAVYGDPGYIEKQDEYIEGARPSVVNNPVKIVGRTFEVSGVDTRATTQAVGQG